MVSKIKLSAVIFCLSVLAVANVGHAALIVTGATQPSNGLFSSLSREAPRVLQQFYDASDFAAITTPTEIITMSFRLPPIAATNYPSTGNLNFARYDITLAKPSAAVAAANGLTSATFADNMLDPVLVRSGPLTIPQFSFLSNAANVDAEFSFEIAFDTPYLYTPGDDLVMVVRHSGHGDVNGVETRWNFDGYAWTNGSVVSTTADVDAAVGNFGPGSFNLANKIQFRFVPEPSSVLLGLLATVLIGSTSRRWS